MVSRGPIQGPEGDDGESKLLRIGPWGNVPYPYPITDLIRHFLEEIKSLGGRGRRRDVAPVFDTKNMPSREPGILTSTEEFREVLRAFRLIFPSLLDNPGALALDRLCEIVANSSDFLGESVEGVIKLEQKLIRLDDGRELRIYDLFERALSDFSLEDLRNIVKVRPYEMLEQHIPFQLDKLTLFPLIIETLQPLLKHKIHELQRYRPDALDPMMSLADFRESKLSESSLGRESLNFPGTIFLQTQRRWTPRPALKHRSLQERAFSDAFELNFPPGMSYADLFNGGKYLNGRIQSAGNPQDRVLDILTQSPLSQLFELSDRIGDVEEIKPWVQWLHLPKASKEAVINRILMGLRKIKPTNTPHQGDLLFDPLEEDGEYLSEDDLWYVASEVREGLQNTNTLSEMMGRIFPGVDLNFLINSEFTRGRFEAMATSFANYFQVDPNHLDQSEPTGVLLYTFFDALAKNTQEYWDQLELFPGLQAYSALPPDPRERSVREDTLRSWEPLTHEENTGATVLLQEKLCQKISELIGPWQRTDAIVRTWLQQHLIKHAPQLIGSEAEFCYGDPNELVEALDVPGRCSALIKQSGRFAVVSVKHPDW